MRLPDIFLLAVLLILARFIPSQRIRRVVMMIASGIFVFMFQPVLPVRELDFGFPLLTVLLTVIGVSLPTF